MILTDTFFKVFNPSKRIFWGVFTGVPEFPCRQTTIAKIERVIREIFIVLLESNLKTTTVFYLVQFLLFFLYIYMDEITMEMKEVL